MDFDIASRTSKGARENQEDAALVWPGGGDAFAPPDSVAVPGHQLAVLADGMGGHAGGALASRTVCERFIAAFAREHAMPRERLRVGLNAANRAIALAVDNNPRLSGMGSTLIGATFGPDGLQWVSVGDSPLYLYRRGEIALINEDHSLAPALDQLAAEGRITPEQARADPRRHMLRSAITGDELDLVDLSLKPLVLEPGDYVLLASDGIHTIEPRDIARIVAAFAVDGAAAIAAALIREVESARDPHQDNTTVVVVRQVAG